MFCSNLEKAGNFSYRHALSCRQGDDAPPPRVIVFADTEEAAVAAATPLRNALWGKHKLAVLLPHGDEPIKVTFVLSTSKTGQRIFLHFAFLQLLLPLMGLI